MANLFKLAGIRPAPASKFNTGIKGAPQQWKHPSGRVVLASDIIHTANKYGITPGEVIARTKLVPMGGVHSAPTLGAASHRRA